MDQIMPVMDGDEATLAIRRWERAAGRAPVPIVAVTAAAMTHECDRYIAKGMDAVLAKPYACTQLCEAVMRCLPALRVATDP